MPTLCNRFLNFLWSKK